MTVTGTDADGQPFSEQTGTVELGSQGCKYFSTRPLLKDSWLTLEIPGARVNSAGQRVRARVVWLRKSLKMPGLFQVGVEFETPGNVWRLADAPSDWPSLSDSGEADAEVCEQEIAKLLTLVETGTYYQLLRVGPDVPHAHLKRNYYALARKFHPDHHMNHPERTASLHKIMDAITLAYKTLSNSEASQKYDRQLVASGAFNLSRQQNSAQKTPEECVAEARQAMRAQNVGGAILWLRKAVEMEPNSARYLALLARALSTVASLRREASEHLVRATTIDPLNFSLHLQLAAVYEDMKLPWRARPYYLKALEIDPENEKARERLASLDEQDNKKKKEKRGWVDRVIHPSSK